MLSSPSVAAFAHHAPRGSRRATASTSSPAGRERSAPASSGRSGGSHSVVTRYVVPQLSGASAVMIVCPKTLPVAGAWARAAGTSGAVIEKFTRPSSAAGQR
jgi:hypothetical protein